MWSLIEPKEGEFNWSIIEETIRECHKNDLHIVLGTPTATPPKWLIDKYGGNGQKSTILIFDEKNHPRRFGSRRHYSFSSLNYRNESNRIVTEMARRFGRNPSIVEKKKIFNKLYRLDGKLIMNMDAMIQYLVMMKMQKNNFVFG